MLSEVSHSGLQLLKNAKNDIDVSCTDMLDTLPLALKIVEAQVKLGVEVLEAERKLITLKNTLFPIKKFYKNEYSQVLAQMILLYMNIGREHLALFYSNLLLQEKDIASKEIRLFAHAISNHFSNYAPEGDLKKLLAVKVGFFQNERQALYLPAERLLAYVNSRLRAGKMREVVSQFKELSIDKLIDSNTTYVSNNLLEIVLGIEVAKLSLFGKKYKFPSGLKSYTGKYGTRISIENTIVINLLKAANTKKKIRKHSLEKVKKNYAYLYNIYDLGRSVKSEVYIRTLLNSLITMYSYDITVQSSVYELSQYISTLNTLVPVSMSSSQEKLTYKDLVIKQQMLKDILDDGLAPSDDLIQEILSLKELLSKSKKGEVQSISVTQNQLLEDETLLYTADLSGKTVIYKLTKNSFTLKVNRTQDLRTQIEEHRHLLTSRGDSRASGQKLRVTVGLKDMYKTLIVASSGILETLPFSTLYNDETDKWLIQEMNIYRLNGLERLLTRRGSSNTAASRIAIANPTYYTPPPTGVKWQELSTSRDTLINLAPLKESTTEAKAILSNLVNQNRLLLTMGNAVESNVKEKLNQRNWGLVSFSTHTVFPSYDTPISYPGLALSIDYQDLANDSLLLADEIAEMNFSDSVVLLAACNTANASEVGGSFNSLITSFHFAGAYGVVASQWRVNSEETVEFMSTFAELLNSEQFILNTAIAMTQSKLADKLGTKADSASHWGAWEVYF